MFANESILRHWCAIRVTGGVMIDPTGLDAGNLSRHFVRQSEASQRPVRRQHARAVDVLKVVWESIFGYVAPRIFSLIGFRRKANSEEMIRW